MTEIAGETFECVGGPYCGDTRTVPFGTRNLRIEKLLSPNGVAITLGEYHVMKWHYAKGHPLRLVWYEANRDRH